MIYENKHKPENENNYYNTSDLYLVATLTLWYPLESLDKTNPEKTVFNFLLTEDFQKTLDKYWRNELLVEPKALLNNLKVIKTRLYEE